MRLVNSKIHRFLPYLYNKTIRWEKKIILEKAYCKTTRARTEKNVSIGISSLDLEAKIILS
jgi:hypothetical protein